MKYFYTLLFMLLVFGFTACETPHLFGKKVKKEYFQGGKLHSKFIMDDDTEQNGVLQLYGYDGHLTSIVTIHNGVKDGIETGYDGKKRVLWKYRYINGRQHGIQKAFYPNGEQMIVYSYKNGIRDGFAYSYNKDGTLHQKVLYRHGIIVN